MNKKHLIISILFTTLTGCSSTETKQLPLSSESSKPLQHEATSETTSLDSIEKKALEVLKQMSDVLSSSPAYTFKALIVKEQVLDSGQKLQYDSTILVKMQRPNALFVNEISGAKKQMMWYHDTTFTLLDKKNNFYATTQTPDNTEDMLDFIMENYSINLPLADFVFKEPYSILTENVISGFYVAEVEVNGIKTHHLAFHQDNVDWQIWIDAEGDPVPIKFVITYRDLESVPQFAAFFKEWNLSPDFKTNEFVYQPSKSAVKIDFRSEKTVKPQVSAK
jgi:hypothetical protein